MKQIILSFIASILSLSAYAQNPKFTCGLDDASGEVTLSYTLRAGAHTQVMEYIVGRESSWKNPQQVQQLCQQIKQNLRQSLGPSWDGPYCTFASGHLRQTVSYKSFAYAIPSALARRLRLEQNAIVFKPSEPIAPEFVQVVSDDDLECSHK
jgi:hypothetical protein